VATARRRHPGQRGIEFAGVARVEVATARGLHEALRLLARLRVGLQVEADDVRREVDALRPEFDAERARVRIAGFLAIADQDHRGLLLGVAQRLGGLSHRGGDRRHPRGLEAGDLRTERSGVERTDRLQQFDVRAVALATMRRTDAGFHAGRAGPVARRRRERQRPLNDWRHPRGAAAHPVAVVYHARPVIHASA